MPILRNVSDTAIWVALYRARETERPDAVFHDPYAKRFLAGRGEEIAVAMKKQERNAWAFVTRTLLFDRFIAAEVAAGADMVINLAAGLDTRPYRMNLPASLRWIEVDLPPMIEWKSEVLADTTPVCRLERIGLDLADVAGRRALFARLRSEGQRIVVVSEGLLIYLEEDAVAALAEDLVFDRWILDVASPGLRDMMNREVGTMLTEAKAPLRFAPANGPRFFEAHGWRVEEVRSMLKNAPRLPLLLKFFRLFPEGPWDRKGKQPWSAVCLLAHTPPA
jgi:methyltransferase (TIGR00027 family)